MYLREATKSVEEGSLRHWRHLVIINRHLYAMGGLHLFDFPFWGDGTIADAIGFYLSVEKSFAHAGYEKLWIIMQRSLASMHCGEKNGGLYLLRQTCRNKPSIVNIYIRTIRYLGSAGLCCGQQVVATPSISVLDFPLWLVGSVLLVATAWLKCWPRSV